MMYAYVEEDGRLVRLPKHRAALNEELAKAVWIDLMVPDPIEVEQLRILGVMVPTLADMEEIEISNRLYRQDGVDYMTAVLPGESGDGRRVAMPVSLILSPVRLVTVRHHSPRPFLTYGDRADRSTLGCRSADRLFSGLVEEIVARLADLLESSGRVLDETTASVFERPSGMARNVADRLQGALRKVGREAELMAQVRLGLLTLERMQAFYLATIDTQDEAEKLRLVIRSQMRDVHALEVHADFLSTRVSLVVDATLGLITLEQNNTMRILSVVAALFLPPTLIASIYGMNFTNMPELDNTWGYFWALMLMLVTAAGTWLMLRWKNWL